MQNHGRIMRLAAFVVLLALGHAEADSPKGSVQLTVTAEKEIVVVNRDGKPETQRVAAARVVPDDTVTYTIKYVNTGEEPAEHVLITNPVPQHMRYLVGTAAGSDAIVTFSVDGGQVFDAPEALEVATPEGGARKATAEDYTHIRWTLQKEIPSSEAGEVSFRARLQ